MKTKLLLISILISTISCKNNDFERKNFKKEIKVNSTNQLSFEKFENTKWIVGEIGLNGEKPDTIIFDKPKTLSYISTDTGKEVCNYTFSGDTLIFISHTTEYDSDLDKEVINEDVCKLQFKNNSFKYIYVESKREGDLKSKRIEMEKLNVIFRKI
jgi:hypothetical protein